MSGCQCRNDGEEVLPHPSHVSECLNPDCAWVCRMSDCVCIALNRGVCGHCHGPVKVRPA